MTDSANPETNTKSHALDPFWLVLGAYLFTFFWIFIRSVFFNPGRVMMVFETVRRLDPIGYDLMRMVGHATAWVNHTISPYAELNNFPPMATLMFVPFTWFPLSTSYVLITILTLICFFWITFLFPYLKNNFRKIYPVLVLIFVTGLTSYGLQFELERGQFYTLSIALAFGGIYLFHKHPKLSWLAYLLFSLSIQLKIFPIIFIFLFVRDWRDWKKNLLRFAAIITFNIGLLFIFGWNKFLELIQILTGMAAEPFVWVGNMSVRSFSRFGFPRFLVQLNLPIEWANNGGSFLVEIIFTILIIGLIGLTIWRAIKQNRPGINPFLLFVCVSANLLIPPISHDYKLPTLAGAAAILLISVQESHLKKRHLIIKSLLVLVFSLAFFTTQYSYVQKSPLIANNFPAIFSMLAIGVLLYFMNTSSESSETPNNGQADLTQI